MRSEIAVVVVTYNSAQVIEDLLDSLPAALEGHTSETVIVDNGSTDATVSIVENRTDCQVIRRENRGYAAGINAGVDFLPRTEAILVLNPDVRLMPGSVSPMLATLRSTGTGIVAPRVLSDDGSLYPSLRREPTLLRAAGLGFTGWEATAEWLREPSAYDEPRVVSWATGAVLLVSRECHDALAGWDESFFLYSEETDFSVRAAEHGWSTRYDPRATAVHIGGHSGRNGKTQAMLVVNRVRFYARRHGRLASWSYFGLTVAKEMARFVRGDKTSGASVAALLMPSKRPPELGCSEALLPR